MRKASWVLVLALPVFAGQDTATPPGWGVTYGTVSSYSAVTDFEVAHSGKGSALITPIVESPSGDGGLIQSVSAEPYRGKRLVYSGYLKGEHVRNWAGLWIRAEDVTGKVLTFDNMFRPQRRLTGSTEWQKHSLVIDVPIEAHALVYGVQLQGPGNLWADDVALVVDPNASVTAEPYTRVVFNPAHAHPPSAPANAGFEQ